MPVDVANYAADAFNGLHDFPEALDKFDGIDGDSLADTTMKDLFRHHGVENILACSYYTSTTLSHTESVSPMSEAYPIR